MAAKTKTLTLTKEKPNDALGMNVETNGLTGAHVVTSLQDHSPAMVGGVKVGFEVVSIDGQATAGVDHDAFLQMVRDSGISVKLKVKKGGADRLGERSTKQIQRPAGSPTGLGFVSEDGAHSVTKVIVGGVAAAAGISVGDKLIKVAGQETSRLDHDQLLAVIGSAGTSFVIEVETGSLAAVASAAGISSIDTSTEPLGVAIVSDESGVHKVTQCGRGTKGHRMGLKKFDEVQEVNGTSMVGAPHDVLLATIKSGGHELTLVVSRGPERRLHKLRNRSAYVEDLGIVIEVTKKGLVQVKDLVGDGAATASGLQIGDVIIDINGKSVLKKSLTQVVDTLRSNLGPEVPMVVCSQPHECTIDRPAAGDGASVSEKRLKYTLQVRKEETPEGPESLGLKLVTDEAGDHVVGMLSASGCAARAGIREGDWIVGINGVKMTKRDHDHVLRTLVEAEGEFSVAIKRLASEAAPVKGWTSAAARAAAPSAPVAQAQVVLETDDYDEVAF